MKGPDTKLRNLVFFIGCRSHGSVLRKRAKWTLFKRSMEVEVERPSGRPWRGPDKRQCPQRGSGRVGKPMLCHKQPPQASLTVTSQSPCRPPILGGQHPSCWPTSAFYIHLLRATPCQPRSSRPATRDRGIDKARECHLPAQRTARTPTWQRTQST